MRKIIEESNLKYKARFKGNCRCWKCGTKFEYETEDIYNITRDFYDSSALNGYVKCPFCENAMKVKVRHGIIDWVLVFGPVLVFLTFLICYFVC